jgi:RNA polymerase sigma-70 factor (ECF subfamily)
MTKSPDLSYRELSERFFSSRSEKDYNMLYVKVKPGLRSYILNIVKDAHAADDVLANTLTKLWTKIDQYKPEYQITTWLYKIAFNECIGYIRKRNRKYSLDSMQEYGIDVTTNNQITSGSTALADDTYDIVNESDFYEEDNFLQEQYEAAVKSINMLKPMYRGIMQDRLLENMKYEEIASKHDVSLQTIKNRVRRGKILIQRALQEKKLVKTETF